MPTKRYGGAALKGKGESTSPSRRRPAHDVRKLAWVDVDAELRTTLGRNVTQADRRQASIAFQGKSARRDHAPPTFFSLLNVEFVRTRIVRAMRVPPPLMVVELRL
jgi:hypothetical protein